MLSQIFIQEAASGCLLPQRPRLEVGQNSSVETDQQAHTTGSKQSHRKRKKKKKSVGEKQEVSEPFMWGRKTMNSTCRESLEENLLLLNWRQSTVKQHWVASDNCVTWQTVNSTSRHFFFYSLSYINTWIVIEVTSDCLSLMKGVFSMQFKVKNVKFVSFERKFHNLSSATWR